MTMQPPTNDRSELPFELETRLEKQIAADRQWLEGITWGRPRPGHPEGQVMFHIRDVLNNVDRFFSDAEDRSALRLIALVHDTFKNQVARREPGAQTLSHGNIARKFAERYIQDLAILEVIELHDEAYKASLLMTRRRDREAAERRARELIDRLGNNVELFMRFYLCDTLTGDKSTAHYEWFRRIASAVRHST